MSYEAAQAATTDRDAKIRLGQDWRNHRSTINYLKTIKDVQEDILKDFRQMYGRTGKLEDLVKVKLEPFR